MTIPERYPYREARNALGESLLRPLLPIRLSRDERSTVQYGLLDTGATVNVLPYEMGLDLGLSWTAQTQPINLSGNLGQHEARAVILIGQVGQLEPVPLIFAWTRAADMPLLLGQVNFFAEFDVCFFWARATFEVSPKA